mmetsp:Transcript_35883/g.100988  ORF Transcript_35883/g.100988 Transcript_35883/m.100988 type:complete len:318 (-) Transcript_35883:312-1265(-)
MCFSVKPFLWAALTAKSRLLNSSSATCAKACGSSCTTLRTNSSSARRSFLAPWSADPWPSLAASRMRSLSERSASEASFSAAAFTLMHSRTKPRSPWSSECAWPNAFALCLTASSTIPRSLRKLTGASAMAAPPLATMAPRNSSRSFRISDGATSSTSHCRSTAVRHMACRQLSSFPASPSCSIFSTPHLSAAAVMACRTAEFPARASSSGKLLLLISLSVVSLSFTASSSLAGRSFLIWNSLKSFAAGLSRTISAIFTPVRKKSDGISRRFAARFRSKSASLSTFRKSASHFDAPQSARLSLWRGVTICPPGKSRW